MRMIPKPVLKEHDGVIVVRDDLFSYGSKARFLDDYFAGIEQKEVVYGSSPRWGFAQISLAFIAKRHGKKCTVFVPKSKELSPYSERAAELGARIKQVSVGFLSVCEAKARKYVADTGAFMLPCGLSDPVVLRSIRDIALSLMVEPDEVWTVAGSGTLTRGLQMAFSDAKFFAVQTGMDLGKSAGRAEVIVYPRPFGNKAKVLPPFPSVLEYDAKAWEYIPKDGKKLRLFWNVGA